MGNSFGKITPPVSTDDVAPVLGENSNDVATLCMSDKINLWARYKPEAIGTHVSLNYAQRKNNNFGIEPSVIYSNYSQFLDAVKKGTFDGGWKYNKIDVSSGDWARLDDFVDPDNNVGYNHYATNPFGTLEEASYVLSSEVIVALVPPPPAEVAAAGGMLSLEDFNNSVLRFKDYYPGVLIYSSDKSLAATTTTKISEGTDWQINFGRLGDSYAGPYVGVPFLSSAPFEYGGDMPTNAVIVGVGVTEVWIDFVTAESLYKVALTVGYINSTSTTIHYKVSLTNNSNVPRTFDDMLLRVSQDSKGTTRATLAIFDKFTLQPGQSKVLEGDAALSYGQRTWQFAQFTSNYVTSGWVGFIQNIKPEV